MRKPRIAALVTLVAGITSAGAVLAGTPAHAATPTQVVANARCSRTSWANLQVQREDTGKLSIDFGVDMAVHKAGVVWKAKITDNATTVYSGLPKTIADGSFSVTRVIAPQAGANHVTGTASNPATGETCKVSATL